MVVVWYLNVITDSYHRLFSLRIMYVVIIAQYCLIFLVLVVVVVVLAIQRRHKVHIGFKRNGHQLLGQLTGSKAGAWTVRWRRPWPSVGAASPARNPLLLTPESKPPLAQYIRKLALHRPTLSSRRVPAKKEARVTLPGPAASSLS
jgi:hypothetical protein